MLRKYSLNVGAFLRETPLTFGAIREYRDQYQFQHNLIIKAHVIYLRMTKYSSICLENVA